MTADASGSVRRAAVHRGPALRSHRHGHGHGHERTGTRSRTWSTPVVWFAVAFVIAASVARTFTYPPLGSADEPAHLDYVLLVWHGHLPVFQDGLTYEAPFGVGAPVQWVSQHPPLYYLLLAPLVGPIWDSGHPLDAVIAGRLVNALLVGGVTLASAWAASRCFPTAVRLPGAVAIVVAMTGMLIQQGGSIYNDSLYALLCALACGVAGAALRAGVDTQLLVAATVVGAAGMTTRLSFLIWLIALVVAVAAAPAVRIGRLHSGLGRLVAAAAPLVAAALASGWFWIHNKTTVGNFAGRHAAWGLEHADRREVPLLGVATDWKFYARLFSLFRGVLPSGPDVIQWILVLIPTALAVLIGVLAVVLARRGPRRRPSLGLGVPDGWAALPGRAAGRGRSAGVAAARRATVLVVAMFVAVTLLLVVMEISYVSGGGAPIARYALTVLPVVAMVIGAGLTSWRPLSGALTAAWLLLAVVPYLSLVDLGVGGIVPYSTLFVRLAFVVSLVALAGCAVSVQYWPITRRRDQRATVDGAPITGPDA